METGGTKLKEASFKGARIKLDGTSFAFEFGNAPTGGTCKLDPDASPKTIDMTFTKGPEKGNTSLGIYKLEGDVWTICLTLTAKERPTKFEAELGSGLVLETL